MLWYMSFCFLHNIEQWCAIGKYVVGVGSNYLHIVISVLPQLSFFYCIFHVGMYIATKVVMSCLQYVVIMCYVTDCYYVLCHELSSVCLDYFFFRIVVSEWFNYYYGTSCFSLLTALLKKLITTQ
jgi:hypothetical protein